MLLIERILKRSLIPHQLLQPRAPLDLQDRISKEVRQTLAVRHPTKRVEDGDVGVPVRDPVSHVIVLQERRDHFREVRRREQTRNGRVQLHAFLIIIIIIRSRRRGPRRRLQPDTQYPQGTNQRILELAHLLVRLGYQELEIRLPVLFGARVGGRCEPRFGGEDAVEAAERFEYGHGADLGAAVPDCAC